ncbi:TPA: hypothetical protein PTV74_003313 [Clostridium botulinum]|nr:hypothetical protein [Clostridium botulinum]HDK7206468.1 hypothetical protein [Clostridium botulinum]HDK7210203.1 hypothetical protein [Clostridium botulinum]HDK7265653.1 hypothetical protein [Clostridium botulinum]HDK7269500.1 hypothetical protein [Clostridium botulinum]
MDNNKMQERIENIIENEVLVCQSSLVEKLLESEIVYCDDIENMYINNSEEIEELQNKIEELEDKEELTEQEESEIEELENKIEELEEEQEEPQEIFEWWVVSNWLANKLEQYGEPILNSDYGTWWGRTCTGQALKLDYIFQQIVEDIFKQI